MCASETEQGGREWSRRVVWQECGLDRLNRRPISVPWEGLGMAINVLKAHTTDDRLGEGHIGQTGTHINTRAHIHTNTHTYTHLHVHKLQPQSHERMHLLWCL